MPRYANDIALMATIVEADDIESLFSCSTSYIFMFSTNKTPRPGHETLE